MDRIDDLEAFLAVVEEGGLTAAARRLGRSLQSISRSLTTLERSVGVALVRRTTRRSEPTDVGLAFYRRVGPAVSAIHEARRQAADQGREPSGQLRIGASVQFAPIHVVPVVAAFMERYPRVEVELRLSDRFVDMLDEGLDLAIRIGELPDSSFKARRLGALRAVVFGAPAYFAKHGRPEHPNDLAHHQCVVRTTDQDRGAWPFHIDGAMRSVRVAGRFRTDNSSAMYAAVAQGLGVGFTPLWQIRDLVDQGTVELILTDFELPSVPIHAVWPATRRRSAKARLFTEFLAARLRWERL